VHLLELALEGERRQVVASVTRGAQGIIVDVCQGCGTLTRLHASGRCFGCVFGWVGDAATRPMIQGTGDAALQDPNRPSPGTPVLVLSLTGVHAEGSHVNKPTGGSVAVVLRRRASVTPLVTVRRKCPPSGLELGPGGLKREPSRLGAPARREPGLARPTPSPESRRGREVL